MPTALAFVRANLGIAILPESAAGTDTSDFMIVGLNNRFANRQIELLQRRDAILSPASESLVRHLLQNSTQESVKTAAQLPRIVKRKLKIGNRRIRLLRSNQ